MRLSKQIWTYKPTGSLSMEDPRRDRCKVPEGGTDNILPILCKVDDNYSQIAIFEFFKHKFPLITGAITTNFNEELTLVSYCHRMFDFVEYCSHCWIDYHPSLIATIAVVRSCTAIGIS